MSYIRYAIVQKAGNELLFVTDCLDKIPDSCKVNGMSRVATYAAFWTIVPSERLAFYESKHGKLQIMKFTGEFLDVGAKPESLPTRSVVV